MDELIPTRATLIGRLKDWQDHSSWQDFFDTYWKLIYDIARKSGLSPSEAQDVVQETMISVAKNMPKFKYDPAIGSFKGWLLKVTRWRITDQIRKRGPTSPSEDEMPPDDQSTEDILAGIVDGSSTELEALWNAEWEKNLFNAAVAKVKRRLDPQKYQIFDVYANKEWAPEKVAEAYKIPIDQVYSIKHRVTEMIKDEVRRLEVELI